jgi:S-(hydroxymethyl)mycothiol dehydrogenase
MLTASGVVVRTPNSPARVETILVEPPGPGEILVRIVATGVCHSDLHAKLGNFGTEFPYLLGHEATGIVEALGPGVTRPAVGDAVLLCWRAPCGGCRFCAAGNPTYCAAPVTAQPRMRTTDGAVLGRVLGLGTFCTHTVVAAAQALPVSPELSPAALSLIGCGVATGVGAALRAAAVRPGSTVAVFGCGAVGVSVIQGARLAQASRIVAVDLVPRKLEWARAFGATDVIDARAGNPAKQIRALTGHGVDYAFEAVGLPETLGQALASCDLGGVCTLIGVPAPKAELTLSLSRFFYSRANLRATFYGDCLPSRDFPILIDLYRRGALRLDELISERVTLDDAEAAFAAMERGETLRSIIIA